ncbi:MAG: DUF4129 domain-containing protein, partial [Myxococcales bacterium]|nr:DUF4129 domain-containing protein [Myxococcales bacterium]
MIQRRAPTLVRPGPLWPVVRLGVATLAALATLAMSAALATLATSAARAAPVITVGVRTRLELGGLVPGPRGARIEGRLIELDTGAPLIDAALDLQVDGVTYPTTTGADGRFVLELALERGEHVIGAGFAGSGAHGPATVAELRLDLARATPTLELDLAPLEPGAAATTATLRARVAGAPTALPIVLEVGAPGGMLDRFAEVTLDDSGQARLELARDALGDAGPHRVRAVFAGTELLNPASVEAQLLVRAGARFTSATLPTGDVAWGDTIVARGALLGEADAPVAGATVDLVAGGRTLASATTDARGGFALRVPARRLGAGPRALALDYAPAAPWLVGVRSAPAHVVVAEPRPVPTRYTVAALALTALVVAAVALARAGLGLRLVAALLRLLAALRDRPPAPPARPHARSATTGPVAEPGWESARPGLLATLRRAVDQTVSGVVIDYVDETPIAGVLLTFQPTVGPEGAVRTDHAGCFTLELAPGMHRGEARAHGYITAHFSAALPHRGELRGVRVRLVLVREQVFALYREVALPLLPHPNLVGIWTPRELLTHVRALAPAGALATLTDFVEEACFSPRIPDEAVLTQARVHVDTALREQAGSRHAAHGAARDARDARDAR